QPAGPDRRAVMDIELREHGPAQDVPRLSDEVRRGLAPLVEVTDGPAGRSRVRPGRKVGVLRVAGGTVSVQPKIDIAQLLFLADYATKPVGWRDPLADVAETGDLTSTVADSFARLAERALSRGPLHGYQPTTASLPVLRGRLRLADQLAARHGAPFPFEVSYATYGPDLPGNRPLAAAPGAAARPARLRRRTPAPPGPASAGSGGSSPLRHRVPLPPLPPLPP